MEIRTLVGGAVATCTPKTSMSKAAEVMMAESVGSLAVMDGRRLAGIITERDFLRAAAVGADLHHASVDEWMTPDPDVVEPDLDVTEAAQWMLATGYRHLPVMEDDRLIGIASIKDVLWAVTEPAADRD
ncbi:MAG TPA: CBS domain-containing protein [Acidimicrobiia bacterium]|nr:CBS domain-containing protein [Acidimicrobiia bacterium]